LSERSSLIRGVAIASWLSACMAPGTGGGITGTDPLGPLAAGPATTAVGLVVASGVDPTGISGMVVGHLHQAEMNANLKVWQAQNPRVDPQAELAKVEALRQKAIADGVLNPDGSSKQ
jgi:hypothetical protein